MLVNNINNKPKSANEAKTIKVVGANCTLVFQGTLLIVCTHSPPPPQKKNPQKTPHTFNPHAQVVSNIPNCCQSPIFLLIYYNHHFIYFQGYEKKCEEELKRKDMKIILELDQKVMDQQVTLERAGVPGFFVTNNPQEVRLQMYLLDFIMRCVHLPDMPT